RRVVDACEVDIDCLCEPVIMRAGPGDNLGDGNTAVGDGIEGCEIGLLGEGAPLFWTHAVGQGPRLVPADEDGAEIEDDCRGDVTGVCGHGTCFSEGRIGQNPRYLGNRLPGMETATLRCAQPESPKSRTLP